MYYSIFLFLCLPLFSCQSETSTTSSMSNTQKDTTIISPQKIDSIFGYRFVINGDFDGDGIQEQLIEHFVDVETGQETAKFYEDKPDIMSYQNPDWRKTEASLHSKALKPLIIDSDLGVYWLETIGDIDGDGGDEIGWVPYHADHSSTNLYYIYSYKNNNWIELFHCDAHDWQFPQLPDMVSNYGLFGFENQLVVKDKQLNDSLEQAVKNYKHVALVAPQTLEFDIPLGDLCDYTFTYNEALSTSSDNLWLSTVVEDHAYIKAIDVLFPFSLDLEGDDKDFITQEQELCEPAMYEKGRIIFHHF